MGPLPNGTWYIYKLKDERKYILRLQPSEDVLIDNRDGFLIHGAGNEQSAEASSKGCK